MTGDRTMKKNVISVVAVTCLAVSAIAGCSSSGGSGDPSGGNANGATKANTAANIAAGVAADPAAVSLLPDSIKSKGTISVAMELDNPPTSFLSPSNEPEGFNVDIARLIAAKLGLKLKIDNVKFDTIVPGLAGGRYDFTATDMSATSDRLKVLDMINYWRDGSALIAKAGNPENLNINDTSVCGKSLAVTTGSTQQQIYVPLISKKCTSAGKPAVKAVVLPDANTALTQLASGRIDGLFIDTPVVGWSAKQKPSSFSVAGPQYDKPASLGSTLVALALKKGSPLTKAVQAAMQSIMDGPSYMQALNKWGLGFGAIKTASIAGPTGG
jgi:polar amino acid transport system substrate-binding protein